MSDVKAARGFCISAGTFTEEARKYIEGRPIDLIEKNELTKILKQITIQHCTEKHLDKYKISSVIIVIASRDGVAIHIPVEPKTTSGIFFLMIYNKKLELPEIINNFISLPPQDCARGLQGKEP